MLPNFVDGWRAQSAIVERPKPTPLPREKDVLRIFAMMSCPRLGWTDTWSCITQIFQPLGIGVATHTGVFWGQALTLLFEQAVDLELDYAITLDYDSVFTAEDVKTLIGLMELNPDVDAIVPVQVRREVNLSMFGVRDNEGKIRAGDPSLLDLSKPLSKITCGHFGLTILRVSSLAKLPKPWFNAVPNVNGEWRDGQIDEDVWFWLNAEESGWEVRLANHVRVGHIQNLVSWPDKNFIPRFQYFQDWSHNGAPNL
jgi:hypothetical protein